MADYKTDFRQSLDQRLLLKLSPQQIQFMQLLQLPTLAMEQRIKDELENNPALEEIATGEGENAAATDTDLPHDETDKTPDDWTEDGLPAATDEKTEWNIDDYLNDEDREDYAYKSRDHNYPAEDDRYETPLASHESFQEYLLSQLGFLPLSADGKQIGEVIIGNIDENGYLQRTPEAIANDLAFYGGLETTVAEVEKVLSEIQSLDPPGVGARNLQECLRIQLNQLQADFTATAGRQENVPDSGRDDNDATAAKNDGQTPEADPAGKTESDPAGLLALALKLVDRCFEDFLKRRYEHLRDRLHIDEDRLQQVLQLLSNLNPKPGAAWSGHEPERQNPGIVPDFYLFYDDEALVLTLHNKNEPVLKVSDAYNRMLQTYKDDRKNRANREAAQFVKEKIDAARWFIDMVRQRQQTLLSIGNCLVNFQKEYFSSGDPHRLKPMRLKDIASETGYDISTVSRVTAQKYMQTPFGIIALKTLFSQGIQNEEGTEISTARIKEALKTLVEAEDKTNPLSDDELVEALKEQGLSVARRTIAKYRQQLDIPVARMRRTL